MDTTKACAPGVGRLQSQVRQFLTRFAQDGSSALTRLLDAEQLQALMQRHCPQYRDRVYSPLATLSLFLEQVLGADHSCQDTVARGLSSRVAQNLTPSSLNTGPYLQSTPTSGLLVALGHSLGQRLCQAQRDAWHWRGRDRYYTGYFTLARLRALGVDFVSCQHQLRHMDFRQGKRLGRGDHVACWSRPVRPKWMTVEEYEATPLSLEVRETRVGNWLLISSLNDAKTVSREDLSQLYGWRWQVELDLRANQAGDADGCTALQEPGHGGQRGGGAFTGLQSGALGDGAGGQSGRMYAARTQFQRCVAAVARVRRAIAPRRILPHCVAVRGVGDWDRTNEVAASTRSRGTARGQATIKFNAPDAASGSAQNTITSPARPPNGGGGLR